MKKLLIFLLVIVGLAAVCVVTCPDRQTHKEAILQEVDDALGETINDNLDDDNPVVGIIAGILGGVASKVGYAALENQLRYNNYFVVSTTTIDISGEEKTVAVGALGHVFVLFDADDLKKLVD